MTRRDLIAKIRKLVDEHGHEWKTVASKLNESGIRTLKGLSWTDQSCRAFYTRAASRERTASEKSPNIDDSAVQLTASQDIPPVLTEWLDSAALADLRAVLDWWRSRQQESMILSPSRPIFKGPRRNSGFHINSEILKRATAKLKKDKVRTGGSMSLLMEVLLWEYIGRPQDLLEPVPHEEPDAWSVLHALPPEVDYESYPSSDPDLHED
jgi:hypothetical protein